jgi:hypothetical protein
MLSFPGKKIVLVYDDPDYRYNRLGGESVSLKLSFPGQDKFSASGDLEIVTNPNYIGGVARQAENLAFSRVFEAGHYAHGSQLLKVY